MSCSQVDRDYVRRKKVLKYYTILPYKLQHTSHGEPE